jgi:branched-chain amino acid transport system substrate-binding protein
MLPLLASCGTVPVSGQRAQMPQTYAKSQTPAAPNTPQRSVLTSRLDRQPLLSNNQTGNQSDQVFNLSSARPATGMPLAGGGAAPTAATPAATTKVALLLPLSGRQAALGGALQNAAQLAVFDQAGGDFELMPRDTGDTPEGAQRALRDALASGAQLVIGPLFSGSVAAIKPLTQSANIPVIALSNDASMAGNNVYIAGFSPQQQVQRVISFARSQNVTQIAALIPTGAYGDLVLAAARNAAKQAGGNLVRVERYDPTTFDFTNAVQSIMGVHEQINGLLLAEGGDKLRSITQQLAAQKFDNNRIRLLGTGLWDEADIGRNNLFVVGGWYAGVPATARNNFAASYQSNFGQQPPRLASLAYDATMVAITLARRNTRFDQASLTDASGFNGIDGLFRLTMNGTVERNLAINQITTSGADVIDAARSSF